MSARTLRRRLSSVPYASPQRWHWASCYAKVVKNRLHLDIHVSGSRSDPLATG